MCAYNFGGSGCNLTEFYQGMWLNVDTNFTRGAPYKIGEGKKCKNSAQF